MSPECATSVKFEYERILSDTRGTKFIVRFIEVSALEKCNY